MKKVLLASVAGMFMMFGVTQVRAEETNFPFGVNYSIGVMSKYVSQWSSSVFDTRPSVQGDLGLSHESGLYVDAWFAFHSGETDDDLNGDEVDFIAGWSGDIGDYTLDSALVYYDLVPVVDGRVDNVWAPFVKVSKAIDLAPAKVELSPFGRVEVAIPEKDSSFDGGLLTTAGAELGLPMADVMDVKVAHYYTYDSGVYDGDENVILGLTASLETEVGGGMSLVFPSFQLTQPLSSDPDRETETVFGFSVKAEL
jgi:hypothetical protein